MKEDDEINSYLSCHNIFFASN